MKTEERILTRALEMFNEKGIEYVGLRELAADLNIRVSNINYYFPTKDDLVNRLSIELNLSNSTFILEDPNCNITHFLSMLEKAFLNHQKYRCLLISFVHLIERNSLIASRYKKTSLERNSTLKFNLKAMVSNGYLKLKDEHDFHFLVAQIAIVVRFWISESIVSYSHLNSHQQVNHFISMIARLLLPYASVKGKKQIQPYLCHFVY